MKDHCIKKLNIFSCFILVLFAHSQAAFVNKNSSRLMNSVIRLGGLFPIGGSSCKNFTRINSVRGIQRVEAMRYAVDQINKNNNILRNIRIDITFINTCDSGQTALDKIIESFVEKESNIYSEDSCQITLGSKKNILGFVGPSTSPVSKDVARLFRLFEVPQISYASTSPDLDDKELYPYFLRTVPPDKYQVRAIHDLCEQFAWTAVAVVYSEGDYGKVAFEHFYKMSDKVCISASYELETTTSPNYDKIFRELQNNYKNINVIVLFCTFQHFKSILLAAGKYNFIFIIGEIYGFQNAFEGKPIIENIANGSIIFSMKSVEQTQKKFEEYFNSLTPKTNLRNKWFKTYWQEQYKCNFSKNDCPARVKDVKIHDDKIPYVIDAVYAFASALDRIYRKACPERNGICNKMSNISTEELLYELLTFPYEGVFGNATKFDQYGNLNHGYDISYYKYGHLKPLGAWINGTLSLKRHPFKNVESFCSVPCKNGYSKLFKLNQPKCCYNCVECGENQVPAANLEGCNVCKNGTQPNRQKTRCVKLPVLHLDRMWVIAVCTIAGIGSVLTIWCTLIFYYYKDSDIIIASAPELSYPLLLGILLSYILTFFLVADQTKCYCVIRRFGLGFCFSLCYSSLLTKTIRLVRVFNINRPVGTPPPKFIDTPSQLFILFALVFVQSGVALVGLFLEPPSLGWVEEDHHNFLFCRMPLYDIVSTYVYNFLLVCTCTVYAFRTRKVPACFNEARSIGFAMYTTLVVWIAFLPFYVISIKQSSKTIALCMNVVLHATSMLACVFGRKIYMIVCRWERTRRKSSLHSFTQSYCVENDFTIPRKMTSQSLYSEITKLRSMSHASLAKISHT